ncbi:MAG: GAF domain-containing protein [Anaerolineae bacterium]|nr:GAF domain-containing protein [Anaerolineae bacterium]
MSQEQSSSRELYFLYELAKVFASSIDLPEITEYVLDGVCALLGTEQGLIFFTEGSGALHHHASRGLTAQELDLLSAQLQPVVQERRLLGLEHPRNPEGAILAAPLIVRDTVQGVIGIATAYVRRFTPQEQERLFSVSHLAALAMDNARLHDRVQSELDTFKLLIQAAQRMGEGNLSAEEAAELEKMAGWDEISRLGQEFGRMAKQVLHREEILRQEVQQLSIEVNEAKRKQHVTEITETDYFQQLQKRATDLRKNR